MSKMLAHRGLWEAAIQGYPDYWNDVIQPSQAIFNEMLHDKLSAGRDVYQYPTDEEQCMWMLFWALYLVNRLSIDNMPDFDIIPV